MAGEHHEIRKVIVVIAVIIALTVFGRILSKPFPYLTKPRGQTASVITAVPNVFTGWKTFTHPSLGFSIQYPPGFTPNGAYRSPMVEMGRIISGTAFVIPISMTRDTNLSADSYIAVETQSNVACVPSDFVSVPIVGDSKVIGGNQFVSGTALGAAAGNLYDETVYVTKRGNQCYALRYFIHSTNLGNYPAGTIKGFDREYLVEIFDDMASTFRFTNEAVKTYSSVIYGLSFSYPSYYYLETKGNSIILTEDTAENKLVREGRAPGREGPTAITIDIYKNEENDSAQTFITTSGNSNYTLGNGVLTPKTIGANADVSGIEYTWSGLYEGRSFVVSRPDYVYVFSVTRLDLSDRIISDYNTLMKSVSLSK